MRRIVSRIAAGKENGVKARTVLVKLFVLGKRLRAFGGVLEVKIRGRPDPIVHFVTGADFAELSIHHFARQRHERAFPAVLKRNPLDAVRAEQRQLANVLLKLFVVPTVVGICRVPITELVTANRVRRGRGEVDSGGNARFASGPIQLAQQLAHAEKRAARIRSLNPDSGFACVAAFDCQAKTLGAAFGKVRPLASRQFFWPRRIAGT